MIIGYLFYVDKNPFGRLILKNTVKKLLKENSCLSKILYIEHRYVHIYTYEALSKENIDLLNQINDKVQYECYISSTVTKEELQSLDDLKCGLSIKGYYRRNLKET